MKDMKEFIKDVEDTSINKLKIKYYGINISQ